MEFILQFIEFIMNGFILTGILLCAGYHLFRQQRKNILKLITLSAFFLIVAASVFFILMMSRVLFEVMHANDDTENSYVFLNRCFGKYWYGYWSIIVFKGLAPQILWIKKCRRNSWMFLLLIPFIKIDDCMVLLLNAFSRYRASHTFLSSTWNLYWSYMDLLLICILYAILLIAVYLITRNKMQWWNDLESE